jgi:hypothetical protein
VSAGIEDAHDAAAADPVVFLQVRAVHPGVTAAQPFDRAAADGDAGLGGSGQLRPFL